MTRRTLVSLTALATLATLSAACSSNQSDGDGPSPATTAGAATTTVAASTTSAAPVTTLPTYATTIDELLTMGRPIVLAHTGGEDNFPASTLFSYEESVKAGVDVLDLNVLLTKDNVLLVQHDDSVDRNTNGTGKVADLTFAEINALDGAYWFGTDCADCHDKAASTYLYRGMRTGAVPPTAGHVADDFALPSLQQVIEKFPNIPLNIEIKGKGEPAQRAADALNTLLHNMHREKATVVASFDDKIVSYFHSIAPDVEVSPGLNVLTAYVLNGTPIPDGMRILQLPPEYSGLKVITPKLVADATRRGYPIWIWPNNRDLENYDHYLSYLRQGIAGLNINFPEQGVAALHRYQGDAQLAVVSPSAGCSAAAESLAADSTTSFTLPTNPTVKGSFIEHVPPTYDGTHALPLVIDLHGWSQPAALKFTEDAMPAAADRYRFITIAPDITRPVPLWDTSLTGTDAEWVSALVDHLETTQCIDRFRVYATGMSNGAMMTSTLACTMGATLAAVAPVAGVHDPKGCSTTRHVPLMAFHGTDDPYLSYTGGYGPKVAGLASPDGKGTLGSSLPTADEDAIPVPDRVQGWATRNGCDPGPTTADIAAGVTGTSWVCPANGTTELITITGGGHTWPGSAFDAKLPDMMGSTTTAIDATEMIWDFFATHPIISE